MLREVELGTWKPPRRQPPQPQKDTRFLEFASDWFALKRFEIEPTTASNYRNELTNHLLPFFAEHQIPEITFAEVDRYRQHKVRENAACQSRDRRRPSADGRDRRQARAPLQARQEAALAALDQHADRRARQISSSGHLRHAPNPAAGKRRRLKVVKHRPVYLDSAEHVAVMLEAAADLDERDSQLVTVHDPRSRTYTQRRHNQTAGRKAAIAVLMLAGPRAAAGGALLERDLDLANGRITVGRDKTDAGMREIDTLPLLREILTEHRAQKLREDLPTGPDDPVLITATGRARDRYNLADIVAVVVRRADELQAQRGGQPLPVGITPHKLRHTFASILVAIGKDPNYVMNQLGHTDAGFTLRVYTHIMQRSPQERTKLKALVEGHDWTLNTDAGDEETERP